MNAATGTTVTLSRRVKAAVATGLLALSLMGGAGVATMHTGAAAPTSGQVNGQTQAIGTVAPTVGASAVAKPKGTAKPKPKPQPPVECDHWSQYEWIVIYGEDPGPNGGWNCAFA